MDATNNQPKPANKPHIAVLEFIDTDHTPEATKMETNGPSLRKTQVGLDAPVRYY